MSDEAFNQLVVFHVILAYLVDPIKEATFKYSLKKDYHSIHKQSYFSCCFKSLVTDYKMNFFKSS